MSESNLATTEIKNNSVQTYSHETIELIKNTVAPPNMTNSEFEMFIYQAKRTGLDPLSRQIYCIKTKEKVSINATIDGFRLIAERTGLYEGQTPVMWCGEDGKWVDVWLSKGFPSAAKVGVLRKGFSEPLYAIARWDTYAQTTFDGKYKFTWNRMPDLMLGKCAEALALRKAFPQELSNLYSDEEGQVIEQEHNNQSEIKPVTKVTLPDNPFKQMDKATSLDEVKKLWSDNKDLQTNEKFAELKDKRKKELSAKIEEADYSEEPIITDKPKVKKPTEKAPTKKNLFDDDADVQRFLKADNKDDQDKIYNEIIESENFEKTSPEYQDFIHQLYEENKLPF